MVHESDDNLGRRVWPYQDGSPISADLTDNDRILNILPDIPQGDSVSSRRGNKITLRKMRVFGLIEHDTYVDTSTITGNYCRIFVIWDKRPDSSGTTPNYDDIFGSNLATTQLLDPVRDRHSQRYQLIGEKVIISNPSLLTSPDTNIQYIHYDFEVNVEGIQVQYLRSGQVASNAIYVGVKAGWNYIANQLYTTNPCRIWLTFDP